MKMRWLSIVPASSILLLFSCGRMTEAQDSKFGSLQTIYASVDCELPTRTAIDGNLKTTWLAGDAINVFFGSSESSRFVTSESGEVAQFKGSIDVVTGGGEGLDDDTCLWGVYPYDANTTCDGKYVTLTLPAWQKATENTIANGLFPLIAKSRNFYMSFYNLCGSFWFSVKNSDICSVTLSGNNGEPIAGKARVSMGKTPSVEEIIFGEKELSMTAPDGGCFRPGVKYYFALYPTVFEKGLTITYHKKDSYASYVISKSYTLRRNVFSYFKDRDSELTFTSESLIDWEKGESVEGKI